MGNCDKKSTGNRKFTGKCPYILYINGQFTEIHGQLTVFHGIYGIFPGKFTAGKCPVFSNYGAFPGSKFSGECTVNPVKYDQPPVNLRKICKRTVNWPLIYKMYGHFSVNSRFPVLFLSQLPITGSVKLRLFFTVYKKPMYKWNIWTTYPYFLIGYCQILWQIMHLWHYLSMSHSLRVVWMVYWWP